MPENEVTEETRVPMKAVIALLAGCAMFTSTAVGVGVYFGSKDASAAAVAERVTKLEGSVDALSSVDRRLARIEGALQIKVPAEDRLPAARDASQ